MEATNDGNRQDQHTTQTDRQLATSDAGKGRGHGSPAASGGAMVGSSGDGGGAKLFLAHDSVYWKLAPIVVSAAALVLSFVTARSEIHHSQELDQREAKREFRSLVQRVSALPREDARLRMELMRAPASAWPPNAAFVPMTSMPPKAPPDDSIARLLLLVAAQEGMLGENASAAEGLLSLLDSYPRLFRPSEYLAVTPALVEARKLGAADALITRALADKPNAEEQVIAYRCQGVLHFIRNRLDDARRSMQTALDSIDRAGGPYLPVREEIETLIPWVIWEFRGRHYLNAQERLSELERALNACQDDSLKQELAVFVTKFSTELQTTITPKHPADVKAIVDSVGGQ